MTVKAKIGRRRYIYFENADISKIRQIERLIDASRVFNYKGLVVLRVRNDQLEELRRLAETIGLKIRLVSGTMRALSRKILELKGKNIVSI
jgi:peroxiredoxin